ncbi:PknH-like extracellular domain-containing protein [Mycolicibacterium rutilum]|uniref:PknH-like extracellular domain-containing protein n=1 Tax=Mycolicibacterium rutilum TaxID=370526 RepID=A0A1H6L204_MYCRU|nr:sensor domain-containing protein [Mycolicibacterium rutilum]SEH79380.1 PknH-like extracellular domain-containing protein [Mycolicibacterium rutilum]
MRRSTAALGAAMVCVLVGGCADTVSNAVSTTTTRTMVPRPLVARELPELLLSPGEVDAAMGAVGMAVTSTQTVMSDNSATMAPRECLAVDGAAEAPVYVDSGATATRDQSLNDGDNFAHYLKQAVVLFPLVRKGRAFFDASAQQWQACREYTHLQSGTQWTVGRVATENDVLSVVATQRDAAAPGWACGRALAVRNNVVIDVNTCSAKPADSAVRIANQIGEKVAARW